MVTHNSECCTGFKLELCPGASNEYVAVVSKVTRLPDGSFYKDFGVSSGKELGVLDSAKLVEDARLKAEQNVAKRLHCATVQEDPSMKNKSTLQGGGNKPATKKQMQLISNLCDSKNIDMNSYIASKGYDPNNLTGSDSDKLIRNLKSKN